MNPTEQPTNIPPANNTVTPPSLPTPDLQAAALPAAGESYVPQEWPGAFGLFKFSKESVRLNLGSLVGAYLLFLVAFFGISILLKAVKLDSLSSPLTYLVYPVFAIVMTLIYLAGARGQKMSIGEALGKLNFKLYLKMLGLYLLLGLIIFASTIALVVPFFFVLPRVILAPYYLLDKNMGVMDSLETSWKATKGNAGKIWGIIGATLVMYLPTLTIIGIPVAIWLMVMYSAAIVLAYRFIDEHPVTPLAPSQPSTPAAFPPTPAA